MKQLYSTLLIFLLFSLIAGGQQLTRVISDRHANSQRVQEITTSTNESGEVFSVTNSYVQLEPGLNYWNGNGWSESVPAFSIVDGVAVAERGSHKVILQPNINRDGAVYMKAADGAEFWSSPFFLALRSTETGQGILIATLKDSIGQLVAPNVVLYTNAFDGDGINAAVRCVYRTTGYEQDVVLYSGIDPSDYGMDPLSSKLELWTEFRDPPPLTAVRQAGGDSPEDLQIEFGSTTFTVGTAFLANQSGTSINVGKHYGTVQGRHFLVESVSLFAAGPLINELPPARKSGERDPKSMAANHARKVERDEDLVALAGWPPFAPKPNAVKAILP